MMILIVVNDMEELEQKRKGIIHRSKIKGPDITKIVHCKVVEKFINVSNLFVSNVGNCNKELWKIMEKRDIIETRKN